MMRNSKLVLVTGGARSGKSDFAERYAAVLPGRHAYVATAFVSDDEMARRIALHRKRRPASWATWEVPRHLPDVVDDLCKQADVVLVDCLTIYFSNYLWDHDGESDDVLLDGALTELRTILKAFRRAGVTAVLVTNELGSVSAVSIGILWAASIRKRPARPMKSTCRSAALRRNGSIGP